MQDVYIHGTHVNICTPLFCIIIHTHGIYTCTCTCKAIGGESESLDVRIGREQADIHKTKSLQVFLKDTQVHTCLAHVLLHQKSTIRATHLKYAQQQLTIKVVVDLLNVMVECDYNRSLHMNAHVYMPKCPKVVV